MTNKISKTLVAPAAVCAAMFAAGGALAASDAPPGHRIGYAMYEYEWALYQTPDGKTECPKGFNDGPREQFKVLFPERKDKKYTVLDTQLARHQFDTLQGEISARTQEGERLRAEMEDLSQTVLRTEDELLQLRQRLSDLDAQISGAQQQGLIGGCMPAVTGAPASR